MLSATRHKARGFTLLELLVVLVIVSGLIAISLPLAQRHLKGNEVDVVAKQIATDLRLIRSLAANTRQTYEFSVHESRRQYRRGSDGIVRHLPEGLSAVVEVLRPSSAFPGSIVFFSDGTSNGGKITLTRGSDKATIDISRPFGDIRINE